MPNIPPNIQLILGVALIALAALGTNSLFLQKIKDLLAKYLFPKNDPVVITPEDPKPSPNLPLRPELEISVEESHYQLIRLLGFFASRKDEIGIIATASLGKHLYEQQQELLIHFPKTPRKPRRPKSKTKEITSVTPTLPTV